MFWRKKRKKAGAALPRVSEHERIYAIGDIHGRNDLLLDLLERIDREAGSIDDDRRTRIVFLGDYADRGDATKSVLDTLRGLSGDDSYICLKGNHEQAMLDFVLDPVGGRQWVGLGGQQTLASFGIDLPNRRLSDHELTRVHEDFLVALQPYLKFLTELDVSFTSGDVFFCHAGVNPSRSLERQSENALLWGHPDGQIPIPVPGKRIVHGHFDASHVRSHEGRICVDTGAYYSGVLTAVRLDNDEDYLQTEL